MSSVRTLSPPSVARQRAVVFVALVLSAALLLNDAFSFVNDAQRGVGVPIDLSIECIARALMIVLAWLIATRTLGDFRARLLMWGLAGISLDTYWQTAYDPGSAFASFAMTIKYTAVPFGLAALTRLAADFGPARSAIRSGLYHAAVPVAVIMGGVGLWHGILWVTSCSGTLYDVCGVQSGAALATYYAYLALDVLLRAMMIAAALAGLRDAWPYDGQRLLLIAASCVVFELGTILNFCGRFIFGTGPIIGTLRDIDAVTTLLLPIGLALAVRRGELFDVQYALTRGAAYVWLVAVMTAAIGGLEGLAHQALHKSGSTLVAGVPDLQFLSNDWVLAAIVAAILAFAVRPLEERSQEKITQLIVPDRAHRLEALSAFETKVAMLNSVAEVRQQLLRTLKDAGQAAFADVFLRDPKGRYPLEFSSRSLSKDASPRRSTIDRLKNGKIVRMQDSGELHGATLALPMPVAGNLYGFVTCGPKTSQVNWAHDEIRELAAIARATGATLFALKGAQIA